MNATVNRRPGSATLSGVRLTPTLAPRALSSIACSEASGFKGLNVSFVYKFVYSTTAVRQSCRSLSSPRLNATQAAAPAARIPIMPAARSRRVIPEKRLDGRRGGSSAGSAETSERSLRQQFVEGGGERRASLPELFVTA